MWRDPPLLFCTVHCCDIDTQLLLRPANYSTVSPSSTLLLLHAVHSESIQTPSVIQNVVTLQPYSKMFFSPHQSTHNTPY